MIMPAEAFAETTPLDMSNGTLFKFRGEWALLVGYENDPSKDFIILTGSNAGQLMPVKRGIPKGVFISSPFSWFPAVSLGAEPAIGGKHTTSLTLAPDRLVIFGGRADDDEHELIAYGLDGMVYRDPPRDAGTLRFHQWSAHLQHNDRPFESIAELFTVDAVARNG